MKYSLKNIIALALVSLTSFYAKSDGQVALSSDLHDFLVGGIELPLMLLTTGSDSPDAIYEPHGSVLVEVIEGTLVLSGFQVDKAHESSISPRLIKELSSDIQLASNLRHGIGQGSEVRFDTDEMMVLLSLASGDMGISDSPAIVAKPATRQGEASMVTSYNASSYFSGESLSRLSEYNFSSSFSHTLSYQEYNAKVVNFLAVTQDGVSHDLDSFVLSRDYSGIRVDAGMESNAPQRVGTISNFSVEKLYYASVSNVADSVLSNSGIESLIPIVISMPSSGEVRVYKDERLIYLAQLALGRHELDTSTFPSGVYAVRADVVINGVVRETHNFRVNKPANGRGGQQWVWQLWAGEAETKSFDDENNVASSEHSEHSFVGGVNIASSLGEVTWDANIYRSAQAWVAEGGIGWQATEWLSFDSQWMESSKSAQRRFYQMTLSPGWGSLILSSERGEDDAEGGQEESTDYGSDYAYLSLPLPETMMGGTIGFGYQVDRESNDKTWTLDYSQQLLETCWLSLTLDTGFDRTFSDSITTDYYVSLNASLPLGGSVDVGVSERNGIKTASVSAGMGFDGFVNYMTIDAQGELQDSQIENASLGLQGNYENTYVSGSGSISVSSQNATLSNNISGSVAFNKDGIAPGNSFGDTGFMVLMPEYLGRGELELLVDNAPLPLHAGKNFVAVSPYEEHSIYVDISDDAQASYDVLTEDERYTLYPGNVATIKPHVKRMLTVFGRLVDESGNAIANATVKNHIGEAVTDEKGAFSIDVDASVPEVEIDSEQTGNFKVAMNLHEGAGGIIKLKDLVWSPKSLSYIISPAF